MSPETFSIVVAGVAGTMAAALADWWKALTGKKPRTATLRLFVLALVVVLVGAFSYIQLRAGYPLDWGVLGAQIAAGWAAALATHDLASPRRKSPPATKPD